MGHEPITQCKKCDEPFDVYHAPDDRICDGCAEQKRFYSENDRRVANGLEPMSDDDDQE